jgi:hypothetical protein
LYAKNVVQWTLITPVCLLIAVFSGILGHDPLTIMYTVAWIGMVPFGPGHVPPQSVRLPARPAVPKVRRPDCRAETTARSAIADPTPCAQSREATSIAFTRP